MKPLLQATVLSALFCSPLMAQNANHFYFLSEENAQAPVLRKVDISTGVMLSELVLTAPPSATDTNKFASLRDILVTPGGKIVVVGNTLSSSSVDTLFSVDAATGIVTRFVNSSGNSTAFSQSGDMVGIGVQCSGTGVACSSAGNVFTFTPANGLSSNNYNVETVAVNSSWDYIGDIATYDQLKHYATFTIDGSGATRLALVDRGNPTPGGAWTTTDLGVLHATKRFHGLDFDAQGRLIATDDATPCNYYQVIIPSSGALQLVQLGQLSPLPGNQKVIGLAHVGEIANSIYCSASLNSAGTTPTIVANGAASATANNGFTLVAGNLAGQRPVALMLSNSGPTSPTLGGLGLCVSQPLRAVVMIADGTPGQCNGSVSIDLNRYARGLLPGFPNPPGYLSQAGAMVHCQFIGRDIGQPMVTQALEFTVCE